MTSADSDPTTGGSHGVDGPDGQRRVIDRFNPGLVRLLTVLGFGLPLFGCFWLLRQYSVNVIFGDQWDDVYSKDVLVTSRLQENLQKESAPERPAEAFGELEMLQLLDQFFDRAIYYASVGYERALSERADPPARASIR